MPRQCGSVQFGWASYSDSGLWPGSQP